MTFIQRLKKLLLPLFNTRAAGVYFIVFAAAIGIATFIENDFGTSAAQKLIFQSWWFELLLLLFGITIMVNIVRYRMVPMKKWAVLTFHVAIIIILIGAGITRYFSYEGIMHIREQGMANSFLSSNTYLKFEFQNNGETYRFDEPVLFASLGNNHFQKSYKVGEDQIDISLEDFIPNPTQQLVESEEGKPTLKIVIAGANGREEYFVSEGEIQSIRGMIFDFKGTNTPSAFHITYDNNSLAFRYPKPLTQRVMATQTLDTIWPDSTYHPLVTKALYSDGQNNFVFGEFNPKAIPEMKSSDPKVKNESTVALRLAVSVNGTEKETTVYGNKGLLGTPASLEFGAAQVSVSYGAKEIEVPFAIKLNDFIMERYPGTNSASSYASEVTLNDPTNQVMMDYRIFMNNILNYGGYRFFQSSFDKDEKGTYLSVNHDFWGTTFSYLGYFLLTLGMILTLFSKNTRFFKLQEKIKNLRAKSATFLLLVLLSISGGTWAQSSSYIQNAVSKEHAEKFSKVVVQDFNGRMKPIHTLSREVLRKIYRKEHFEGLTADQVLLSMFINKGDWYAAKIIKIGDHEDLKKQIGISENYAAYKDFFSETDGSYKLREEVQRVYSLAPIDRGVYEKELIKIDERLNILSMALSGNLLKVVPNPNDPNNTWEAYNNHSHDDGHNHSTIANQFFNAYGGELQQAVTTKNYTHANHLLDELIDFQNKNGGTVMPSPSKIKAEIFLNNLNVFSRLSLFYFFLGLAFLFFLFLSVFKPSLKLKKVYTVLFTLVLIGFALHTIGLGLRWYVSGRAPWSNGYESMIYIAWTSTLAGVLFTRKSFGGLAATMVLASTILFVSMLSFLDPEITPLVPVLKSYWLTIHVSMEAGSYGFLMLGAIIGIINLCLLIFSTSQNKLRVKRIVQEMSYISELTLIGGLFMVSIGTYLGGVWANESWGRYWGWDAKETWALVTVLVYAFILHMRLIPKLNGLFAYNVATIFGLASVIMTYYGVNYYLSGLHSYATGDPIPIPKWVYVVVVSLITISILAYLKKRKHDVIS
ncbi:MAG: cytochrome c biogenesis protein CcsA [Flavobacteriaceae bacterium]